MKQVRILSVAVFALNFFTQMSFAANSISFRGTTTLTVTGGDGSPMAFVVSPKSNALIHLQSCLDRKDDAYNLDKIPADMGAFMRVNVSFDLKSFDLSSSVQYVTVFPTENDCEAARNTLLSASPNNPVDFSISLSDRKLNKR
jgi:hypothetical protein